MTTCLQNRFFLKVVWNNKTPVSVYNTVFFTGVQGPVLEKRICKPPPGGR